MNDISILFDARLVLPHPTGIGRYVSCLLPELVNMAPDWRFHILQGPAPWPGYHPENWSASNVTRQVCRIRPMSLEHHLLLPRAVGRIAPSIFHYPHFDAPVFRCPAPMVVTVHDAKYLARPDWLGGASLVKRAAMRMLFRASVKRADAVITVSRHTAADLTRLFDVPLSRFDVIYEAADPSFEPARPEAVEQWKKTTGIRHPYLLSVGERRPHKNHAALIRAFAASKAAETHDLVIRGSKHRDSPPLEKIARRAGVDRKVHLLSKVSHADLVAAYTGARLFVLVSLYEGFGLPILEAMACDTPVISSDTTACAEVAGDAALQVNPSDENAIARAIDFILENEDRRWKYIERARQWRRQFTWKRTAQETINLYRRCLERRAGGMLS